MERATVLFPLWASAFSVAAFLVPDLFAPMSAAIVPLLVVIMFGMGVTLTAEDFVRAVRRPGPIGLGVLLQYAVMPLAAFIISRALGLSPELTVGMMLVGASAGGTASNVICFLARGDVALSVTLTMVSTLVAVFATPALTWLYIGQTVPVPAAGMLLSILKIVLVPVLAGVLVNRWLGSRLQGLKPFFPALSMVAIVLIIAIIVALNRDRLSTLGGLTVLAVALHNGLGLAAGYAIPRLLGKDERTCRTLAIEVGMQNSGLSVALAIKHFGAAAALPGAVFSIWHNLSGSLLAALWSRREPSSPRQRVA